MKVASRNGNNAKIFKVLGPRIVVHLIGEDVKLTATVENLEPITTGIPIGTVVELQNLEDANRNGDVGVVVPSIGAPGRVSVHLYGENTQTETVLVVKPENCVVVGDA